MGEWVKAEGTVPVEGRKTVVRRMGEGKFQIVGWGGRNKDNTVQIMTPDQAKTYFRTVRINGKPALASPAEAAQADRIVSRYYGG